MAQRLLLPSFPPPFSPMLREGGVVGVVGGLALVGAAPPPSGVSGGGGRGCRRGSRSDKQLKETAKPPSMAGRVQVRVHVRVAARMHVRVLVRMQGRQVMSRCSHAPRQAKTAPRRLPDDPKTANASSKKAPRRLKRLPKTAQEGLRTPPEAPNRPKRAARRHQRRVLIN